MLSNNFPFPYPGNSRTQQGGLLGPNIQYPPMGNASVQGGLLGPNIQYPPMGNASVQGGLLGPNMQYPSPGDSQTQKTDIVVKPPMCAGGKIQLPKINRSSVMTVNSNVNNNNDNIPKIHTIADTTINNQITDDDLCYNRCPNGEAPIPDFFSGQYICLVPASVTYTVKPGKGRSPDPNITEGSDDTIDYTKGYNVSCQSTDLINLGEAGIQTGNENNIMFGTPVLLKSSLYEDPLPTNAVHSADWKPDGNPKWFCKRPVFGSPTINQVQSPYQFINSSVINNSEPITSSSEIKNKLIDQCATPEGGWNAKDSMGNNKYKMPDFCNINTVVTVNTDGEKITEQKPEITSVYKAIAENVNTNTTASVISQVTQNSITQVPISYCSTDKENNSDPNFIKNDARCKPETTVMTQISGGIPMVVPTQISIPNNNLNIIQNSKTTVSVPNTETTVANVNGGTGILINKALENSVSNNDPCLNPPILNLPILQPNASASSSKPQEPLIQITTVPGDKNLVCDIQAYSGDGSKGMHDKYDGIKKPYISYDDAKRLVQSTISPYSGSGVSDNTTQTVSR